MNFKYKRFATIYNLIIFLSCFLFSFFAIKQSFTSHDYIFTNMILRDDIPKNLPFVLGSQCENDDHCSTYVFKNTGEHSSSIKSIAILPIINNYYRADISPIIDKNKKPSHTGNIDDYYIYITYKDGSNPYMLRLFADKVYASMDLVEAAFARKQELYHQIKSEMDLIDWIKDNYHQPDRIRDNLFISFKDNDIILKTKNSSIEKTSPEMLFKILSFAESRSKTSSEEIKKSVQQQYEEQRD